MRIHESFRLTDGRPARLEGELHHHAYRDISHHLKKIDSYTTLIAQQSYEQGRRTNVVALALHPWFAFVRNYILRRGVTDGAAGFVISVLNAYYVFLKLAKLWELQRTHTGAAPDRADVLAAYRHGADLARRTEPGARHGDGHARCRSSRHARRARRR